MKSHLRSFNVLLLIVVTAAAVFSQDDETRRATGLPMKIGENSSGGNRMIVSGKVTLESSTPLTRIPNVRVTVVAAGGIADQAVANDTGFYVVRNVPRENVSVIVEVDGSEVLRHPLAGPAMGNPRLDFTIPWPKPSPSAKPGVVSASQLFSRTPKNEELFGKAITAMKAQDSAKAIGFFNQVLESDPKDFLAWTELGTLFFKDNSLDNAEACYFKALELKKDYFVALLNLGKLYVSRKRFDNAILALSNAVASNPDSSDAHVFLGESYLQTKKGSLAVIQLNEAIRLDPVEKADIHLRLAALYGVAGLKPKAAAEYKMYLEKRPDYADRQKLEAYIKTNPPK